MWWLALALITLAAAGLRAPQLHESLWLDELHTSWVVSDGLAEIPSRAAVGNQGSLYFGLVWISTKLFGHSDAALRLPSLIAGVLLVPAVFLLGRACGAGRAGAMAGSVFAALDPLAMYYALEARPYALLQFTAALQLTALAGVLMFAVLSGRGGFIALSDVMLEMG